MHTDLIQTAFTKMASGADFTLLRVGARTVTAHDLARQALKIAAYLGETDQDRPVLVTAPDPFDAAAALFGAIYAHRPVALINPKLTDDERRAQVSLLGETVVIDFDCPALRSVDTDGTDAVPTLTALPAEDRGFIVYTSGSSGAPKAILHTYASMSAVVGRSFDLYPEGIDLISMPMHSLGGIQSLLTNVVMRRCLTLPVSGDREAFVAAACDADPATILCFPSYAEALLENETFVTQNQLAAIHTGGEKMSAELRERLATGLRCAIYPAYGLAEYGPIAVSRDASPEKKDHLDEILPGVDIRLKSLGGSGDQDASDMGELLVQGASLMRGYLLPPDGVFAAADDWFATGDVLKRVGPDAYLHLGRKSDLVEAGGSVVALADLERHLAKLEIVTAVAAVTYKTGAREKVAAFVKTSSTVPAAKANAILLSQIDSFCSGLVEREDIVVMDMLPLNAAGKVHRTVLKQEAALRRLGCQ